MGGFNLVCTWSQISTSVAILSSLVTLDLSNNPGLSVRAYRNQTLKTFILVCTRSQISTSVAILSSLVTLDLSNNPGLSVRSDAGLRIRLQDELDVGPRSPQVWPS